VWGGETWGREQNNLVDGRRRVDCRTQKASEISMNADHGAPAVYLDGRKLGEGPETASQKGDREDLREESQYKVNQLGTGIKESIICPQLVLGVRLMVNARKNGCKSKRGGKRVKTRLAVRNGRQREFYGNGTGR